jgi:serine protease Do
VDAAGVATVRLLASRNDGTGVAEIGVGVLVDGRGYVLTPDRLLGEAQVLHARLANGRRLPVQRVWRDPLAGVAVLKIDGGGFPALAMGDSAGLRIGDAATFVGGAGAVSPFPAAQVTIRATGSATGGNLVIDVTVPGDRVGSPLIDQSGRLVAIATTDETSPSGRAIPIDRAKPMLRQAMAADGAQGPATSAAPSPSTSGFR